MLAMPYGEFLSLSFCFRGFREILHQSGEHGPQYCYRDGHCWVSSGAAVVSSSEICDKQRLGARRVLALYNCNSPKGKQPLYRRFWHDTSGSKPSGYGAQSSLRSHAHGRPVRSNTVIAGHSGGKTHSDPDHTGHPFQRLSTRGNTPNDDVPLQGIHIKHEITIQRSTMTWDDEGKM